MRISQKGLDLLKSCEGLRLRAYQDSGGIWTIGYGTTSNVKSGDIISKDQAESLLRQDLEKFEDSVSLNVVNHKITQSQFDALVLFSYNVGSSALKSSTLLKKVNSGDIKGASTEFLKWNKVNGKEIVGLTNRRKKEQELFLS